MTTDELKNIHDQVSRLRAATMQLDREPLWYPIVFATALIVTVATFTAIVLQYA